MDNFEYIENYIKGNLTAEEIEVFEHRLKNDTDFRTEYENLRDIIISIQLAGLKDSLKSRKIPGNPSSNETKVAKIRNIPRRNAINRMLLIAASFLVMLIGGYYLFTQQHPSERLMADAFYKDPGLPTKMSETENYNFYDAMVDYKVGDYQKALDTWEKIENGIGTDTLAYYKAMAEINLENFEKAKNLLNDIEEISPLYQKKQWRYLEILIRKKEYVEAFNYIQKLPKDIHESYDDVLSFLKKKQ